MEASKYISLQEAAQLCQYSQEYLSLRARQGKLRSVKIGRNWVTTPEWLQEYLSRVDEYANSLKEQQSKKVPPPENLPVGELSNAYFSEGQSISDVLREGQPKEKISAVAAGRAKIYFHFGWGMAAIILIVGVVLGGIFWGKISDNANHLAIVAAAGSQSFLQKALDFGNESVKWLAEKVKTIPEKIAGIFKIFSNPKENQKKNDQQFAKSGGKDGMVVFPSSGDSDEVMKEKIKASFSDEVRVEKKDKSSGVIVPIFVEGEGDKYMYVMVPVSGNN